ncbi:MAG: hypothetical protein H7230_02825 [Candidatus Parcubacteria bacterium]|nr:hypothetical protein [Candidatus Paceibacterota bacterium]
MEKPKLPEQLIPPGLESALQDWGDLLLPPLLIAVLSILYLAQTATAGVESRSSDFKHSQYDGALEINPPKSFPNDLVTNPVLEALAMNMLIQAGITDATIIRFDLQYGIRYCVGESKEVLVFKTKHQNGQLFPMKAPTLPTKTKPKN